MFSIEQKWLVNKRNTFCIIQNATNLLSFSIIGLHGIKHECLDQPFLVPTTMSIKLNGNPYKGTATYLTVKGPTMVTKANWILTPKLKV